MEMLLYVFKNAAKLYMENGSLSQAARIQQEEATLFEKDGQFQLAAELYEKTAEIFDMENVQSSVNQNLGKAATCWAQEGNYEKAGELFEKIGTQNATSIKDTSIYKINAKDHFIKAAICFMAVDVVTAVKKMATFKDLLPGFESDKNYVSVEALIQAVMNGDTEEFTRVLQENQTLVDGWKTSALLKVKRDLTPSLE